MKTGNSYDLSDKEIETLNWVSHGKSYEQVGEILHVTHAAIHTRMVRISEKLGTSNRTGCVAKALREGILK